MTPGERQRFVISTGPGALFHGTGDAAKQGKLFAVVPGVAMPDALESVSELLGTMQGVLYDAAMGDVPLQGNAAWLLRHTLSSAKAVVDALIEGCDEAF